MSAFYGLIYMLFGTLLPDSFAQEQKPDPSERLSIDDPAAILFGLSKERYRNDFPDYVSLRKAADEAVSEYLTAKSLAELLPHVRHEGRIANSMKTHYAERKYQPLGYTGLNAILPVHFRSRPFLLAIATDGEKKAIRLVLEETRQGLKVDWACHVGFCSQSFENMFDQRPVDGAVVRVRATLDNVFFSPFHEEEGYRCVRLFTSDSAKPNFGYVKRGSRAQAALFKLLNGNKDVPLILRVSCPANASRAGCVNIDEVVSSGWIIP